jgi:hypothetical protein
MKESMGKILKNGSKLSRSCGVTIILDYMVEEAKTTIAANRTE